MDGDIAPDRRACDVAERYGAMTYLDEVHAVGLYGPRGGGIAERDGVSHRLTVIEGTLGQGLWRHGRLYRRLGGADRLVRSFAPGFIFTTALPPAIAAGALASIRHLRPSSMNGPPSGARRDVETPPREAGLPVMPSESHIVPVLVGGPALQGDRRRVAPALRHLCPAVR